MKKHTMQKLFYNRQALKSKFRPGYSHEEAFSQPLSFENQVPSRPNPPPGASPFLQDQSSRRDTPNLKYEQRKQGSMHPF